MVKRHLSRLNAPRCWSVKRKGIKFITKVSPGPHKLKKSMPLSVIIRDLLKLAKTTSEVKKILHKRIVLVNKKVITDYKFPIGLFDVIEFTKTKEYFRMLLTKSGKFFLKKTDASESAIKPFKIIGKTTLKKSLFQLNFDDGSNLLVKKGKYKVNDTIYMDLEKGAVKVHLPFSKGAIVYILGGSKVASVGKLIEIKERIDMRPAAIIFKLKDGEFETKKSYGFIIGKTKPLIDVEIKK